MSNKEFNAKVSFIITDGKNNGEQYHIQSELEGQRGYIVLGLADVLADIMARCSSEDAKRILLTFMLSARRISEEAREENEADSTN